MGLEADCSIFIAFYDCRKYYEFCSAVNIRQDNRKSFYFYWLNDNKAYIPLFIVLLIPFISSLFFVLLMYISYPIEKRV